MTVITADHATLLAHLQSAPFLMGVDSGRWALRELKWPYVLVDVFAFNGDLYTLRLLCDGYPEQPPTGAFWDAAHGTHLPGPRWPRAGPGRGQALRNDWQSGTALYIPCDRHSISGHDQWRGLYPAWLWKPKRGLTCYLEVVSELIGGADYVQPAA